jgi:hypothetical protein
MANSEPVPDSAMDTGSEDGEPGGTTDATPLTDEERAILDRLRHAEGRRVVDRAAEDSPAAGEAAEDDAPLPGLGPDTRRAGGTGGTDPLDPVFREPTGP